MTFDHITLGRLSTAFGLTIVLASPVGRTAPATKIVPPPQTAGGARSGHAFDVLEKSIPELQNAMQSGAVTARELTTLFLARIQAYDKAGPRLNAIITVNPHALEIAESLDQERRTRGMRGPLHGVPVLVKDNFETADMPTTAGSLALAGFESGRDAFQVRKLREAGAVIIGKTNLHELASGITTISSLGGQTRNPYDLERNPGGSSGGTGAAVAASFAAAGMGSDTCGSIRIPSSHNNLFGLRGTLGLSSRSGIVPLSHTQDIGGPLARSVIDLAIMLDATVGPDSADATTRASEGHIPKSFRDLLDGDALKGSRIGVLKALFGTALEDDEAGRVVRRSIDALHAKGAETLDVAIPGLEDLLQGSSVIDAEFKFDLMDYLAKYPKASVHSLGDILESGRYDASLDDTFRRRHRIEARETDEYRRARVKRHAVLELVLAAMDEQRLDALLYPTIRRKAALIGEPQRGSNCQLSPSSGLPAISMPAGFTDDGLPIGVELLGRPFGEATLLRLAHSYETSTHPRRTPDSTPALVDGKAPAVRTFTVEAGAAKASFTFDRLVSRLSYRIATAGLAPDALIAVTLQRGGAGQSGPVLARLLDGSAATGEGDVRLKPADRDALREGRLYLSVTTRNHPAGTLRAQLVLPPG